MATKKAFSNPAAKVIQSFADFDQKDQQQQTKLFNDLRSIAVGYMTDTPEPSGEGFTLTLLPGEVEYMEKNFADEADAKKKNGEWKISQFVPARYNTAKSTIKSVITLGMTAETLSELSKVQLTKWIAEHKVAKTETPNELMERWLKLIKEQRNMIPRFGPSERMQLLTIGGSLAKLVEDLHNYEQSLPGVSPISQVV